MAAENQSFYLEGRPFLAEAHSPFHPLDDLSCLVQCVAPRCHSSPKSSF